MMLASTTRSLVRKAIMAGAVPTASFGTAPCAAVCRAAPPSAVVETFFLPLSSLDFSNAPGADSGSGGDGEAPKDEGAAPPPPIEGTPDASTVVPPSAAATATARAAVGDELKRNLKPSEIVDSLNRHIVGQHDAKRAVAIAMRNRWRRRQLSDELRKEVTPRNVLLVGPTGYVERCIFLP